MRVFTALHGGVYVQCVCMQMYAVCVSACVSVVYACLFAFGVIVCLLCVFVCTCMQLWVGLLVWECKSMPGFVCGGRALVKYLPVVSLVMHFCSRT